VRLLFLVASELPLAARGVWRLLRGVDDEPLKRVSVRQVSRATFSWTRV
jgi:hypothetical protein